MYNKALSMEIAKQTHPKLKACWINSVLALVQYKNDPRFIGAKYVEGYAIPTSLPINIPMEHGWIEMQNNDIVDPTWAKKEDKVIYFPGVRYSAEEVTRLSGKQLPYVYITGGFGGNKNEAYRQSCIDAHEYCGIKLL